MADFNNLALTTNGVKALLAAQAGATLTLTKIGMGSGSTTGSTYGLTDLVTPEAMLPISEKKIDDESGYLAIIAKMTNKDITEGFYWRETGLFFQDAEGNDVLFAYACITGDQYDYVPAYSDKRYVKHVRIANIIKDSANIIVKENEGLLYVDTLTFAEYKEFVMAELEKASKSSGNNNLLINSNFANPVNQRGKNSMEIGTVGYWIDRWKKYDNIGVSLGDGYVEISRGDATEYITLIQVVEEVLLGKTVTFSVKPCGVNEVVSVTAAIPNDYSDVTNYKLIASSGYSHNMELLIYLRSDGLIHVAILPDINSIIQVEWAKLEIGDTSTAYAYSLYSDELMRCGVPDEQSVFGYKDYYYNSPVNNNLIINSNFANPVNQRGNASMDIGAKGYWIDRWTKGANISCAVRSGYIEIARKAASSDISLYHYLEESLLGKTVTFSVKLYGGDILTATATIPSDYSDIEVAKLIKNVIGNGISINIGLNYKGYTYLGISPHENSTVKVEWAKLELGDHATPYVPRLYDEELQLCQRYYQNIWCPAVFGFSYSSKLIFYRVEFPTTMRVAPTPKDLTFVTLIPGGSNGITSYSYEAISIQKSYAEFKVTYSSDVATNGNSGRIKGALDAEL